MAEFDLFLGDSVEVLKRLIDDGVHVDIVITDMPYGVGIQYTSYDDTLENWKELFIAVVPLMREISDMVIMPSSQIKLLEFIYKTYPPDWLIAWHKGNTGGLAHIGFNDWEPLLVYGRRKGVFMHDHFTVPPGKGKREEIAHPCPKPVPWAEWLVSRSTKPGYTVLDPFMGSGTVGVACMKLDRNFIGIELDAGYLEIARERIDKASKQPNLFKNEVAEQIDFWSE